MIYSRWQRRYGRDTCVFLPELVNYSEEEVEGTARMIGEGATTRGDVARPGAVDEGNGKIAAGSKNLRGIAGAEAGAVFAKGDIAHVVQAIFDLPVATNQGEQTFGAGLGRSEGGDEIHGVGADASRGRRGDGAGELSDLGKVGPRRVRDQIGG